MPLHNIAMSQIIQEKIDLITIKIVKKPDYNGQDSKLLLDEFQKRVGPDINVNLKFVDSIGREKVENLGL